MSSDVEETIKRIQSQTGVIGVIIIDNYGIAKCSIFIICSNKQDA